MSTFPISSSTLEASLFCSCSLSDSTDSQVLAMVESVVTMAFKSSRELVHGPLESSFVMIWYNPLEIGVELRKTLCCSILIQVQGRLTMLISWLKSFQSGEGVSLSLLPCGTRRVGCKLRGDSWLAEESSVKR